MQENLKVRGKALRGKERRATLSFPARHLDCKNSWHLAMLPLRNKCRNSILMTHHYPDLGSASDWSCHLVNLIQPITSTTQIWVVTRHQYGISALISQTPFSITKCRLFAQATHHPHISFCASGVWLLMISTKQIAC